MLWNRAESTVSFINGAFQVGITLGISAFQISILLGISAFQVGISRISVAISVLSGQHPPCHQCFLVQHLPKYWCLPDPLSSGDQCPPSQQILLVQEIPCVDMELALLAPYHFHTHQHRGDYANAQQYVELSHCHM